MKITQAEFRERFLAALASANSRNPDLTDASPDKLELHYYGVHDRTFEEAVDLLWISEEAYFLVIDVAVHPKRIGWFFVRPSGHTPGPLTVTFNDANTAPFKVMAPA